MRTSIKTLAVLVTAISTSGAAWAHVGIDSHLHTGFVTGFMHPFTGLDHLSVMLAVGLWSGLIAHKVGREMLWGPLGFTNAMLAGAALGMQGLDVPAVEPMIAASLVAAGLLVVNQLALRGTWAAALVGSFALFHGLAHGYEMADSVNAFPALAGMLCATLFLHSVGLFIGWSLRHTNMWIARAIGGTLAASGSVLLLTRLA